MSRNGIVYEQVEAIAECLQAAGDNPTIEKVRFQLGTGSNSTIAKHLNDWRSKRLVIDKEQLSVKPIPPDPVNQAVHQVWRQINEQSQAEISKIHQEKDDAIVAIKQQRTDILQEKNKLEQKLQALEGKCDRYRLQELKASRYIKQLEQELAVAHAKNQQVEQHQQTLIQETDKRISVLTQQQAKEAARLGTEVQTWQARYKRDIKQLKRESEQQRQGFYTDMNTLKIEHNGLIQSENTANTRCEYWQQQAQQLQKQFEQLLVEKKQQEKFGNNLTTLKRTTTELLSNQQLHEQKIIELTQRLEKYFVTEEIAMD